MKLTKLIGILTVCTMLFGFASCADTSDDEENQNQTQNENQDPNQNQDEDLIYQELKLTRTPTDRYQFILNGFTVPQDASIKVAIIPPAGEVSGEILLRNGEDYTKYATTFTAVEDDDQHQWYYMTATATKASNGLMFTFNGTFAASPTEATVGLIEINGERVNLAEVTSPDGDNKVEIVLIEHYTIWYSGECIGVITDSELNELIEGAELIETTDYTIDESKKKIIFTAAGFAKADAYMTGNSGNGGNNGNDNNEEIVAGYIGKLDDSYSLWYNGEFKNYIEKSTFESLRSAFGLETPADYTIGEEDKVILTESGYTKLSALNIIR